LIDRLGEPALKIKNEKTKFAVWIGKNGTRIDFKCNEYDGDCAGGSVLMVQRSDITGSDKTGVDFFK